MNKTTQEHHEVNRRGFLGRLGLATAALVAGAGAGAATACGGSAGTKGETLVLDIACLGDRWRQGLVTKPVDKADEHAPFIVEGWIYPEGTIPDGKGFVPSEDGSVGRWMCQGWLVLDGDRPEPHAMTVQSYLFGTMTEESPFIEDQLSSQGFEGTDSTSLLAPRIVLGGTGTYAGANGQVIQRVKGENTSVFPWGDNALNFEFTFDLNLPS